MQTPNQRQGEVKRKDEQYGKPNQQCQKHLKVSADEAKTTEKGKENQGDKTAEEDKKPQQYQQNK